MTDAHVIIDRVVGLSDRYRAELKVFKVKPNKRYPEGIKARFVLIDMIKNVPLLLIDNHAPFGFHVHTGLPSNKEKRDILQSKDYIEAFVEFRKLSTEIINREN